MPPSLRLNLTSTMFQLPNQHLCKLVVFVEGLGFVENSSGDGD